jgi:hypothetical protein
LRTSRRHERTAQKAGDRNGSTHQKAWHNPSASRAAQASPMRATKAGERGLTIRHLTNRPQPHSGGAERRHIYEMSSKHG